ncbi:MAG: maleylpyruvate isomerase N-terminal domain-containing protein [Chloroflexi bacterium]|nr:maleylpyruvate isomerase N-terminal domain-containing protein [Chloroflexota bacterium]
MNAIDLLRYGQKTIDELVDRLRPDDWTALALGTWTAKDVVGHLGAFEVRFAELLAVFVGEEPATNLRAESPATFNDDQAAIRTGWSIADVLLELRDAHRATLVLAARIPAEKWREVGTIPWYGPEYSLDDLLVYSMYGHKREHGPQLEAVLDRSVA